MTKKTLWVSVSALPYEKSKLQSWIKTHHVQNRICNSPVFAFLGATPDCTALYNSGTRSSGIYTIKPNSSEAFDVYCEMKFGKTAVLATV